MHDVIPIAVAQKMLCIAQILGDDRMLLASLTQTESEVSHTVFY